MIFTIIIVIVFIAVTMSCDSYDKWQVDWDLWRGNIKRKQENEKHKKTFFATCTRLLSIHATFYNGLVFNQKDWTQKTDTKIHISSIIIALFPVVVSQPGMELHSAGTTTRA